MLLARLHPTQLTHPPAHAPPPPLQELDLYKNLQHLHVVTYIDHHFDVRCSTLYIFLEYVPGGSIASMLERCVGWGGGKRGEVLERYGGEVSGGGRGGGWVCVWGGAWWEERAREVGRGYACRPGACLAPLMS